MEVSRKFASRFMVSIVEPFAGIRLLLGEEGTNSLNAVHSQEVTGDSGNAQGDDTNRNANQRILEHFTGAFVQSLCALHNHFPGCPDAEDNRKDEGEEEPPGGDRAN